MRTSTAPRYSPAELIEGIHALGEGIMPTPRRVEDFVWNETLREAIAELDVQLDAA